MTTASTFFASVGPPTLAHCTSCGQSLEDTFDVDGLCHNCYLLVQDLDLCRRHVYVPPSGAGKNAGQTLGWVKDYDPGFLDYLAARSPDPLVRAMARVVRTCDSPPSVHEGDYDSQGRPVDLPY